MKSGTGSWEAAAHRAVTVVTFAVVYMTGDEKPSKPKSTTRRIHKKTNRNTGPARRLKMLY
ncbi:hypothetical protein AcW1_007309 [Taiwanofungus camphoratus]|nr:hypothetical protein AcW2_007622 [Antrodia cinnamomea]KAI0927446.1 hypothetical protein AcV5_007988 [Antrodia cinnamomea]KAI0952973.1 hypothetical protein AcW1_007309 [Antrodia cinnamomea]